MRARRRQSGFSLIEVVIAFALLALALTLLLGTLSTASRQVRGAADSARAALHAQSLLALTDGGEPLRPGHSEGEFEDGRYRWDMQVAPYVDPLRRQAAIDPVAPQLLELVLTLRWGEGGSRQRLQLHTLRLLQAGANAVPPPP